MSKQTHTSSPRSSLGALAVRLALAGVAGVAGVWGAGTMLAAQAQQTTPAIAGVVAAGTQVELIKDGFTGTEGPIALGDGSLLFTETQANRITRIAADGSTSVFLENTNGANGLALAPNGDLYAVQVLKPRVGIVFPDTKRRVLVEQFEGKGFGRPNDIVLDSQGGVYFTDSGSTPGRPTPDGINPPAVYYISPKGEVKRLANDIERPNGIQLSPDEKVLYVANTGGEHVLAYNITAPGVLGPRRNFARLDGFKQTENGPSSGADGLAVDADGRLFVASNTGIQVFSSAGQALGTIALPKQPQNLAFAGDDKKTLYVVGRGAAYKINTLTTGYAGRAK
jgi:gluconolactonase